MIVPIGLLYPIAKKEAIYRSTGLYSNRNLSRVIRLILDNGQRERMSRYGGIT